MSCRTPADNPTTLVYLGENACWQVPGCGRPTDGELARGTVSSTATPFLGWLMESSPRSTLHPAGQSVPQGRQAGQSLGAWGHRGSPRAAAPEGRAELPRPREGAEVRMRPGGPARRGQNTLRPYGGLRTRSLPQSPARPG